MTEKEINTIKDEIIFLIMSNFDTFKKFVNNNTNIDIISSCEEDKIILNKLTDYYNKYEQKPNIENILKELESDPQKCLLVKSRIKSLSKITKDPDQYEYLIDKLKADWAKNEINEIIKNDYLSEEIDLSNSEKVAKVIKKINANLAKIENNINKNGEGEYSFTTMEIDKKIGEIIKRDISSVKRFKLGHDILDKETGGFMPGEVLIVLGNINQGKSFVLTNIVFEMWQQGHNVLLLTGEMNPRMFDERIFSRATGVLYSNILNGKDALSEEDKKYLEQLANNVKQRKNNIVTKYVTASDTANSVRKYIEELEKTKGFIPDVLVVDSFECMAPINKKPDLWENLGQITTDFKNLAETYKDGKGLFVISTHQAKTETLEKAFKDINISDVGKSKIIAEKADAAFYMRAQDDISTLNIKFIKARRFSRGLSYNMTIDYSRALVSNCENNEILN
jgi:replicative DNA helicase